MLAKELDGLSERIDSSRGSAPAPPPGASEGLGRARPRVREAVSLVFGLHWSRVESVLAAAHEIERKIALLEEQVETWPSPTAGPAAPGASSSASGAITGLVTDEATGNPLAGVTVNIYPTGQSATTDSTGRWIVTGLDTGTYNASTSSASGYVNETYRDIACVNYCSPYYGTPIAVTDGAVTSGVNFALARPGSISGTVTDSVTGQGVEGTRVRLYSASSYEVVWTQTNANGSYSLPELPPGSYFLRAEDPSYLDQLYDGMPCEGGCVVTTGTPIVVAASTNTPGIDFALQPGGSISGTVTSAATGTPISSGEVQLTSADGAAWWYAYLDASGSYRISGLAAGTYFANTFTWGAWADELYDDILCEPGCTITAGTPILVTLGQETQGVDFSLQTFGAFQGQVTDTVTGFPLPNTAVVTYSGDGLLVSYQYSDTAGDYESGGLLTGTYFAVASSPTHLDELWEDLLDQPSRDPTTGTQIAVTIGSTTSSIDFVLDLGGGVMGRVTDAVSGAPVDSANVAPLRQLGSPGRGRVHQRRGRLLGAGPAAGGLLRPRMALAQPPWPALQRAALRAVLHRYERNTDHGDGRIGDTGGGFRPD